jgi:DNA-binding response OmpR family regulator
MEPVRVLFVDDEPGIRLTMPEILHQHGFCVTAVGTVNEALAEITSAQFDVLISDLNFDHPADGFIVVSAMRSMQPNCVTLILTGYPGFETALEAIRNQVDGYLIKPTSIPALLSLIEGKLKLRKPGTVAATKRIAEILRENTFEITQRALTEMKSDPLLGTLPLTDEQRVEHTPQVLEELATMLDSEEPNRTQPSTIDAAELRGAKRYQFGYTSPLLATHVRLLERAIYEVIHEQLLSLNLSYFMFDLKRLNDSLGVQLEHSLKAFLDAEGKVATERKAQLEAANVRLTELERMSVQLAQRAAAGVAYWEIEYKTGRRRRGGRGRSVWKG